jgi:hypothetical protein
MDTEPLGKTAKNYLEALVIGVIVALAIILASIWVGP